MEDGTETQDGDEKLISLFSATYKVIQSVIDRVNFLNFKFFRPHVILQKCNFKKIQAARHFTDMCPADLNVVAFELLNFPTDRRFTEMCSNRCKCLGILF